MCSAPKRVQIEPLQPPPQHLRATGREERGGPARIAAGEVLEADRDLDQALKCLAVVAFGAQPVPLEPLVHLVVKACVEEHGGRAQRHREWSVRRLQRAVTDRPPCATRAFAQILRILLPAILEPEAAVSLLEHVPQGAFRKIGDACPRRRIQRRWQPWPGAPGGRQRREASRGSGRRVGCAGTAATSRSSGIRRRHIRVGLTMPSACAADQFSRRGKVTRAIDSERWQHRRPPCRAS